MPTAVNCWVLAALSLLTLPASAHHSPAQFDLTADAMLEGTITEFSWRNPHVYIALEIEGPDGKPVTQQLESGGASNLSALGFDGDSLQVGDRVVVHVKPSVDVATSLAGTWVPQGTGFADLAVAARAWPLTETGRAAVVATQAARDVSRSSCIPFGPPALMNLPSAVFVELSDTA